MTHVPVFGFRSRAYGNVVRLMGEPFPAGPA